MWPDSTQAVITWSALSYHGPADWLLIVGSGSETKKRTLETGHLCCDCQWLDRSWQSSQLRQSLVTCNNVNVSPAASTQFGPQSGSDTKYENCSLAPLQTLLELSRQWWNNLNDNKNYGCFGFPTHALCTSLALRLKCILGDKQRDSNNDNLESNFVILMIP